MTVYKDNIIFAKKVRWVLLKQCMQLLLFRNKIYLITLIYHFPHFR